MGLQARLRLRTKSSPQHPIGCPRVRLGTTGQEYLSNKLCVFRVRTIGGGRKTGTLGAGTGHPP